MSYEREMHRRRSIRLKNFDYTQAGAYFITLCIQDRRCIFGHIEGEMILNDMGTIVTDAWEWLGRQYDHVGLDTYIVMPNHLHGIIILSEPGKGGSRTTPTIKQRKTTPDGKTNPPRHKPLGRLIGAFKTISTKHINLLRQTPGVSVWQRNYWEHIIRNERSLDAVRR
jgi:putative transposase